jgi:hypothetical protein
MMNRVLLRSFNLSKSCIRRGCTATASATSAKQQQAIDLELEKSAHNYHPIPRVMNKGEGCYLWDIDGQVVFLSLLSELLTFSNRFVAFVSCNFVPEISRLLISIFCCESGTLSSTYYQSVKRSS